MIITKPVVAIVGSGIAGMRAAKALLKCEIDTEIVIFGDETHRTYNRPGLTKRRYESSDSVKVSLADELAVAGVDDRDLTWRLDARVEQADLSSKVLHLSDGESFAYDRMIVATGVRPRISIDASEKCDLHSHRSLRGLDDARYIHEALQKTSHVKIVGAGFVACELASLAKEYGCEVVMLETRRDGPFESILGARAAFALRQWIEQNGVTFLTGDTAQKEMCDRSAREVQISSGHDNASDAMLGGSRPLLIEAIGSVPNSEWLEGNDLDLSDGVRVDDYMRVSGTDDVFAAGDIARYPDPWESGAFTRPEFWKNAINTGNVAGKALASSLRQSVEATRIAYFPNVATEIFGLRIQIAGNPAASDSTETICGDLDQPDGGVIVTYLRAGKLVGACYIDKGARHNSTYITLLKKMKQPQS